MVRASNSDGVPSVLGFEIHTARLLLTLALERVS